MKTRPDYRNKINPESPYTVYWKRGLKDKTNSLEDYKRPYYMTTVQGNISPKHIVGGLFWNSEFNGFQIVLYGETNVYFNKVYKQEQWNEAQHQALILRTAILKQTKPDDNDKEINKRYWKLKQTLNWN
jgi:hypothetical protein